MTIDELNILKHKLCSYQNIESLIKKTREEINLKWYELEGVKSPSLTDAKTSGDQIAIEMHKHDIRQQINALNRKLDKLEAEIEYLNGYIDRLPTVEQEIAKKCYIEKIPFSDICVAYGYSRQNIYKLINKALLKLPYDEL